MSTSILNIGHFRAIIIIVNIHDAVYNYLFIFVAYAIIFIERDKKK
jgi:hypothetical protein